MISVAFVEWAGCAFGLAGAFLLATNSRISRYGWIAFLLANFSMIALALMIHRPGLLVQQLGFCASSILGLARSGFFATKRS
jgi:hypothetical protein